MTTIPPVPVTNLWQTLRSNGPACLMGRLRHRDSTDYQEWLEERDIIGIIAALGRLSDRELARIGMSRRTLGLDVSALMERVRREGEISAEIFTLVETEPAQMMAAE
jgi:uncharacterized protein YjiS (DUF1127 family)